MKKAEMAEFFSISLTTLTNWRRQGCPVDGDVGAIAEWKTGRDMKLAGLDPGGSQFPSLVGEHTRRIAALNGRIADVNTWPPDVKAEPGMIKAVMVWGLILERALLGLPARIISAGPDKAPECFYSAVFDALDEVRKEAPNEKE